MAGNDGLPAAQPERLRAFAGRCAIELEVAAAHAGRLDFKHDFAGTRRWIGKAARLDLAVADKNDAFHVLALYLSMNGLAGAPWA